jgi:hypothetical protein
VAVTPQAMMGLLAAEKPGDISGLIKDLGSPDFAVRQAAQDKIMAMGLAVLPQVAAKVDDPDPEISTRAKQIVQALSSQGEHGSVDKLVAIRTLGEMKVNEALPALGKLTSSKEPFVAQYARRAVAQIQGKPIPPVEVSQQAMQDDVLLLPRNCGLVAQITLTGGQTVPLDKALEALPMLGGGPDKQQMVQMATAMLMKMVDKVGNIRADGATLGVADNMSGKSGFVVVIGRGLYDRAKVKQALMEPGMQVETIEGMEALSPDPNAVIFMPSDEQIVLVAGPQRETMPLTEVVAALKAGKGGLADNAEMLPEILQLAKSVSPGQTIWAVAKMTDAYRVAPLVSPFDVITLQGRQEGDTMKLKLVAQGKDPQQVQQSVDKFNEGLAKVKQAMGEQVQQMPAVKPLVDFLGGVKIEQAEGTVTVTAELKGMSLPAMGMMTMFGVRHVAAAAASAIPP